MIWSHISFRHRMISSAERTLGMVSYSGHRRVRCSYGHLVTSKLWTCPLRRSRNEWGAEVSTAPPDKVSQRSHPSLTESKICLREQMWSFSPRPPPPNPSHHHWNVERPVIEPMTNDTTDEEGNPPVGDYSPHLNLHTQTHTPPSTQEDKDRAWRAGSVTLLGICSSLQRCQGGSREICSPEASTHNADKHTRLSKLKDKSPP